MVLEVVSTLEENIASVAMSARIQRPEEALFLTLGFEVNLELLASGEGLVTSLARRIWTGLFEDGLLDLRSWSG